MTPRTVFARQHELIRCYDIAAVELFAADAVLELPFAPEGLARRIEGRDAIRAALEPRYTAARATGRKLTYANLVIHDTADDEVIIAELEALSRELDGTTTVLSFIQVYRVRAGEIVLQRDYFDSLAMVSRLRVT